MALPEIIGGLQIGHNYSRQSWGGNKFISMQIPADIADNVIPCMQSLNEEAKCLLMDHGDSMVHYRNQVLLVSLGSGGEQNIATYYAPTLEDIFADDWCWRA